MAGGVVVLRRHAAPAPVVRQVAVDEPSPRAQPRDVEPVTPADVGESTTTVEPSPVAAPRTETPAPRPMPPAPIQPKQAKAKAPKPAAADLPAVVPVARDALSLVGVDPDAEAIWMSTINDPTIPPEARKDLIEDLNEDGFPDPKHVTVEDLPLILNRLDLIEALGPDAIDETNAAAFAEAYKDLLNMADKLLRE
jgi:hypothetical protein